MFWDFERYKNNTAVVTEHGLRLTYQALSQAGNELCGCIDRRCLVFCLCENDIGSLIGYTAFLNHGIVPAMLKSDLDQELLKNLLAAYKPRYIWAPERIALTIAVETVAYQQWGYCLLKTGFEGPQLFEELALLLTTSGSTGSPKFVRQSYQNIRANTDSIVEYLQLDEKEKAITTLPMNYTYGISIINTHLDVGATILLTGKGLMQKEFWTFFKEEQATSFGGVPYTYEMLKRLRIFRMDLPSLKTMTQAGGKLLPQLHKEFAQWAQETGRKLVVMYGQCEATARMAYLPAERSLEKAGSMGIAIPGGRFVLEDVHGQEINQTGVTGELVYYGKNVTLGYAECGNDLLLGDERHGKLETGDMACVDEEGFYYIVGRKKRFLKLFGNRVNLDEAEQLLKAEFAGTECACAGKDDKLTVYTTDESLGRPMCEYLAKKMGFNIAAFESKYVQSIPKNESGKTLYRELM